MTRTKQRARGGLEKRKRDGDADDIPVAKKRETTRPAQTTYDEAVSKMDPSLISDHFAKALKKHSSDSSILELEDRHIPTRSIRDTTAFSTAHVAKELPKYLEMFGGGQAALAKGEVAAPHTLIITSSGIRAADLARELRIFARQDVKVAKLFAKHIKLAESVAFIQGTKINIGIGTPKRPRELIEQGALKVDNLKRIVIDGSYVDEKKSTIFDMAAVFLPLVELLNIEKIKAKLGTGENGIEVLVF